jgi:putative endonuclease
VRYIYLLQSESVISQRYAGVTSDVKQRLAGHNAGKYPHTSKYVPWKLVTYVAFSDDQDAETFERYLKSGSRQRSPGKDCGRSGTASDETGHLELQLATHNKQIGIYPLYPDSAPYIELIMSSFGEWKYIADRDATIIAYRRAERGGADTCDCVRCRNFRVARAHVFSDKFLTLLDRLGIDPPKDAEVYHNARLTAGRHNYDGWYRFIGSLDETGDFPPIGLGDGFTMRMCHASAPRLPSLEGAPVVQIEFDSETVPWLLDEPELM